MVCGTSLAENPLDAWKVRGLRSQRQNVKRNSLDWKPSLLEAREVQSCRWIITSWMLFFVRVRHRGLHVTVRCQSASRHECRDVTVPPSVHQEQEMEKLRGRRAARHGRNGTRCSCMSQVTVGRRARKVVVFSSTRGQGNGRGRCRWVQKTVITDAQAFYGAARNKSVFDVSMAENRTAISICEHKHESEANRGGRTRSHRSVTVSPNEHAFRRCVGNDPRGYHA